MPRSVRSAALSALISLGVLSGCANVQATSSAEACFEASGRNFSEVLACYKKAEASQPLRYAAKGVQQFAGVEKRSFELVSQSWSPGGMVRPEQWKHAVDIYIPADALRGRAVLVANNGTNHASAKNGVKEASDFSENAMLAIAGKTRSIVVAVSNIPNQYLTYTDDGVARREDDSVAHSWKLFLEAPETRPFMSLHIPMVESIVKAMDLAEKELQPWQVKQFIATGASKRAWAAWLAAIADKRIDAIVPFVIDILQMDKVLDHTYQVYGGNWPLAFQAYQSEGITQQIKTENFEKLLKIEDPMRYLKSAYAERLSIPKYIVNASSDDFFVPDSARYYFDQLPGEKALRVAPNASHYGIRQFLEESLITVVNRLQQSRVLPVIDTQWQDNTLSLHFSEPPVKITQWTAANPLARDFRHPCGIRYQAAEIAPLDKQRAKIVIATPSEGWTATFIEATFADGLVSTTPVYVLPKVYPTAAPPVVEPGCKTLADAA